jgi:hypothetical protein
LEGLEFEFLTAMIMKSNIIWDTPYSPLKVNRRFGGICGLHYEVEEQAEQDTGVQAGGKQSCASFGR